MKRIKVDQISSTVGQYLKRRHYTESVDAKTPKKEKPSQQLTELALNGHVAYCGNIKNAFTYSSTYGDPAAITLQYLRFKSFIFAAIEPFRTQLLNLLYPVFFHLYIELINNGHNEEAHVFLENQHEDFQNDDFQKKMVGELTEIYNREDISHKSSVVEFCESKYSVDMNQGTLNYLLQFLKNDEYLQMLQILNKHIHFNIESEHLTEPETQDEPDAKLDLISPPPTPEDKKIENEDTMSTLQKSIAKVRERPPCLPSICFFTFMNTYQGMSCVSLSQKKHLLLGGFEDSTLKLWNSLPKINESELVENSDETEFIDISRVKLHYDRLQDDVKNPKLRNTNVENGIILKGHSGAIYSSCFTDDDSHALSASYDQTVRVWNMKTLNNDCVYSGHTAPVWDVNVSPLNCYFVSCSHDRTAKLWSFERNYPLRTFVGHVQDVDCIKFHPNSTYIATGSSDKTVRLWNISDGSTVRLFQGHRATVYSLAFSPNGNYLATAGEDRRVKIWELSTGALLKDLKGHTDTVFALSFNSDGSVLASGGLDSVIRLWDVRKNCSATKSIDGHISPELLSVYHTDSASVLFLNYAKSNLLYSAGSSRS